MSESSVNHSFLFPKTYELVELYITFSLTFTTFDIKQEDSDQRSARYILL